MADIQPIKKCKISFNRNAEQKQSIFSPDNVIVPLTPQASTPTATTLRRSLRLASAAPQPSPLPSLWQNLPQSALKTLKTHDNDISCLPGTVTITPASPQPTESNRKRKFQEKQYPRIKKKRVPGGDKCRDADDKVKKRVHYKKVVYGGGEFPSGDDVYLKRREEASLDDEDLKVEECRECFKYAGRRIMIECDDCLNGFHLKCLKPPLKIVPEGDWICDYCEAKKSGKIVEFPEPPEGK